MFGGGNRDSNNPGGAIAGLAMAILAPIESRETPAARRFLERVVAESNPVKAVHYLDVRQSMNNGGGPACLRLRVVLSEAELAAVHPASWMTAERHGELIAWVDGHYRDRLSFDDLADPQLLEESRTALDHLTRLLKLGNLYDFQRN